jgi:pimeloyl-ACP methyl ester carboxylesterase
MSDRAPDREGPVALPATPSYMRWVPADATAGTTRGVSLVVHGLNFQPEGMLDVAGYFSGLGHDCLLVTLRGHGANHRGGQDGESAARFSAFREVEYKVWAYEMRAAYRCAREHARRCQVPLTLVGFSLGALLGIELAIGRDEPARYDGILLFAPAIRMRWYVSLARWLAPFPRLVLPSFSPRETAANRGTPIAAYNALFEASDRVGDADLAALNVPGLVLIDSKDELVSEKRLRRWIVARGLTRWRFSSLDRTLRRGVSDYHHLIVDSKRLGPEKWQSIESDIARLMQDVVEEYRTRGQ